MMDSKRLTSRNVTSRASSGVSIVYANANNDDKNVKNLFEVIDDNNSDDDNDDDNIDNDTVETIEYIWTLQKI